jgi:hypothetical protein
VFEMGGYGHVAEAHTAPIAAVVAQGIPLETAKAAIPWFFPSKDWMRERFEHIGFTVGICELKYRSASLTAENKDGTGGLEGWVRLIGAPFLERVGDAKERGGVATMVWEVLERVVTRGEDGSQWLGSVRLRAKATMPY